MVSVEEERLLRAVLGKWSGNTVNRMANREWNSELRSLIGVISSFSLLWSPLQPHEAQAGNRLGWEHRSCGVYKKENRFTAQAEIIIPFEASVMQVFIVTQSYECCAVGFTGDATFTPSQDDDSISSISRTDFLFVK